MHNLTIIHPQVVGKLNSLLLWLMQITNKNNNLLNVVNFFNQVEIKRRCVTVNSF